MRIPLAGLCKTLQGQPQTRPLCSAQLEGGLSGASGLPLSRGLRRRQPEYLYSAQCRLCYLLRRKRKRRLLHCFCSLFKITPYELLVLRTLELDHHARKRCLHRIAFRVTNGLTVNLKSQPSLKKANLYTRLIVYVVVKGVSVCSSRNQQHDCCVWFSRLLIALLCPKPSLYITVRRIAKNSFSTPILTQTIVGFRKVSVTFMVLVRRCCIQCKMIFCIKFLKKRLRGFPIVLVAAKQCFLCAFIYSSSSPYKITIS